MKSVICTALLLLTLAAAEVAAAPADALYCGQQLVRTGDPAWQVARRCPEPFWQESYDQPSAVDRFGHVVQADRYEIWTLNFGQRRFMRQLVFVNGHLARIRSLGYGVDFAPGSRRCQPRELAMAGNTLAEVFARCGEPDFSYELPVPGRFGFHGGAVTREQSRELWTYDFGTRHHPRELLFVNGRLQTIRTGRR